MGPVYEVPIICGQDHLPAGSSTCRSTYLPDNEDNRYNAPATPPARATPQVRAQSAQPGSKHLETSRSSRVLLTRYAKRRSASAPLQDPPPRKKPRLQSPDTLFRGEGVPLSRSDVRRDLADISDQSQPHAATAMSSRQTPECEGMPPAENKTPLQEQHKSTSQADIIGLQQEKVAEQEPSLDIPKMPPRIRSGDPYKAGIAVPALMGPILSAVQPTPSVVQTVPAGVHPLQEEHSSAEGLKARIRTLFDSSRAAIAEVGVLSAELDGAKAHAVRLQEQLWARDDSLAAAMQKHAADSKKIESLQKQLRVKNNSRVAAKQMHSADSAKIESLQMLLHVKNGSLAITERRHDVESVKLESLQTGLQESKDSLAKARWKEASADTRLAGLSKQLRLAQGALAEAGEKHAADRVQLESLQKELRLAQSAVTEANEKQAGAEHLAETVHKELQHTEEGLARAGEKQIADAVQLESLQAELTVVRDKAAEAEEKLAHAKNQAGKLRNNQRKLQVDLACHTEGRAAAEAQVIELQKHLQLEKNAAVAASYQHAEAAQRLQQELRAKVDALAQAKQQLTALQNQQAASTKQAEQLQAEAHSVKNQAEELQESKRCLEEAVASTAAQVSQLQTQLDTANAQRQTADKQHTGASTRLEQLARQVAQLQREKTECQARLQLVTVGWQAAIRGAQQQLQRARDRHASSDHRLSLCKAACNSLAAERHEFAAALSYCERAFLAQGGRVVTEQVRLPREPLGRPILQRSYQVVNHRPGGGAPLCWDGSYQAAAWEAPAGGSAAQRQASPALHLLGRQQVQPAMQSPPAEAARSEVIAADALNGLQQGMP